MRFFQSRTALYALLALVTITVFIGQQMVPPMDRDESRFAQASRQMLGSGDYVTVRFQDELRAKKPAGIYWLQATAAGVLDENHIASYRFVNLLALLGSIFLLYHIGRLLYEPTAALVASAAFASSFLVLAEAHLAKTDTVLMLCVLVQQWALMRIYLSRDTSPQSRPLHWLWFWGAMAAGIMVKGPVSVTVGVLTIGSLLLWHRNTGWLKQLRIKRGLLVVAVICLPWAILVSLATDGVFLDIAVSGDFLAKVKSGQESHGAPPFTYALLFGLLMWPASVMLPTAIAQLKAVLEHDAPRFLLAWIIPFWVVIEIIPTKLPHYPLPTLPAVALLMVWCADRAITLSPPMTGWRQKALIAGHYGLLAFGLIVVAASIWAAIMFGGASRHAALGFALAATVSAGLGMWQGHSWIQTRSWRHLLGLFGAGLMLHFMVFAGVVAHLGRMHVAAAVADRLAQYAARPPAIAAAGYHEPSLVFQLGRDILLVDGREAALFLAEAADGVALVEARQQAVFLDTARRLGLALAEPEQVAGVNISKGEDVVILIYKREIFDGTSSNR